MEVPHSPRRPGTVAALLLAALAALAAALAGPARALSEERRFGDFAIDNWTVADGLPQVAVLAIGQDGDGHLWVGTQSAIARFDGVRFERFDRERAGGVSTSMTEGGYVASDGHVWFYTRDGALRLRRDEVKRFSAAGAPVRVQAMAEWPAGRMLFGTPLGLHGLEGGQIVPVDFAGMDIGALLARGPVLWVGAGKRLLRREGGETRSIELDDDAGLAITSLVASGERLWIGTTSGLWLLEGDGPPRRFEAGGPGLATGVIESLCADGGGSLWAGTSPRLYRVRSDARVEAVSDEAFARNSWVSACFEDREGNLWFGSYTESLFRVWDGLFSRISAQDGLAEPFVWAIESEGDGGVLLGTNNGLMRWKDGRPSLLVAGADLPDPAVYELARLPDGRVWVGTRGGLREFADGRLRRIDGDAALEGAQINAVVADADGSVWVGSSRGLFRQPPGGALAAVADGVLEGGALRVRAVLPQGDGRVLIGTEDGLWSVDSGRVGVPVWASSLDKRTVTSLLALPDGRVLASTLDAGLLVAADSRSVALDRIGPLPTLNAWHLLAIDDQLYVTSAEGVYRMPLSALPDPRAPASADAAAAVAADWVISMAGRNQSGQRARCCNGGARSRALRVGDELWLPSISGVVRLDLGAIGADVVEPLVHVETLWHAGLRRTPAQGPLEIRGEDRDLRIDYTALSFRNPRALRFEYRLDGFDAAWVDAGDRRSAFYTNLPAGEYRFRVRARDAFGKAVQAGDRTEIIVVPSWWERPAMLALACLAGIALVAAGVRLGVRGLRQRTAALEAQLAERSAELERARARLDQANAVLADESQTDALTGLPNRRALFQQLPAVAAAHPEGLVLALVEIDHFDQINDTYGQATGDVVLRDFADYLKRATREGDLLARWGGEEFLLVLAGLPDDAVPNRINRLLEDGRSLHFDLGLERPLCLGVSVGWARFLPLEGRGDWAAALAQADAALAKAKKDGSQAR
jgi:diguanylate cyclase (GGDEF)-like protein